ncbi:LysR substrate-binding domain-containing protein [Sodalis sp. (in: enterobacteria)]|uniref:LysR substrate-binding domain-containing protein n=1 Tax=Sodalis sp. (in: enterobacteria) TaxID=1898979 RepID=UPI003F2AFAB1
MRSYRLPPLGAIKAFDAVATCGSFKQAEQQIGVTPTAISHQIRLLEQFLDTPVFIRGARQVQLTAAGQRLLQASTRAFADLLSAVEDIQRAKSPPTLTLTTTSNFLTHWLVPRLALMKACCPALDLRLHTSLDVMNLAHNAVDVAIRYSMAPDEALDTTLLYEDSFITIASPALGLTPQGELLTATLIHVEDRHIPQPAPDWRHWRALYGPAQLNVHAGLRFADETHAIQAAIAGQGVAIVSRLLAKDFLDKAILCAPFAQTLPGGRYYFVTTREKSQRPDVMALKRWLTHCMAPSGA